VRGNLRRQVGGFLKENMGGADKEVRLEGRARPEIKKRLGGKIGLTEIVGRPRGMSKQIEKGGEAERLREVEFYEPRKEKGILAGQDLEKAGSDRCGRL